MNLYEMNKLLIEQTNLKEDKEEMNKVLKEYLVRKKSKYYMLLSNEMHYYTIFDVHSKKYNIYDLADKIIKEIGECFENLGTVASCELTEDKEAIEIWIGKTDSEGKAEIDVFYLFDYERGVIVI